MNSRILLSKVRMVPVINAVSGMMLNFEPLWGHPIVSTPKESGAISQELMLSSAVRMYAPTMIGSTVSFGMEPWPPLPLTVISKISAEESIGPELLMGAVRGGDPAKALYQQGEKHCVRR